MPLTGEQSERFDAILEIQKKGEKLAIFAVVAHSYVPEANRGVI